MRDVEVARGNGARADHAIARCELDAEDATRRRALDRTDRLHGGTQHLARRGGDQDFRALGVCDGRDEAIAVRKSEGRRRGAVGARQ